MRAILWDLHLLYSSLDTSLESRASQRERGLLVIRRVDLQHEVTIDTPVFMRHYLERDIRTGIFSRHYTNRVCKLSSGAIHEQQRSIISTSLNN